MLESEVSESVYLISFLPFFFLYFLLSLRFLPYLFTYRLIYFQNTPIPFLG